VIAPKISPENGMKYLRDLLLLLLVFSSAATVLFAQAGSKVNDHVYAPEEVTEKAKILAKPEPKFTEEARQNDVDGVVRLSLVLSATGKVSDVVVVESLLYGLTENAVKSA
jgi:hypothetical protein